MGGVLGLECAMWLMRNRWTRGAKIWELGAARAVGESGEAQKRRPYLRSVVCMKRSALPLVLAQ